MITVLGASGFVGSHIVGELNKRDVECFAPQRDEVLTGKFLGDIIYCIGLTGDAKYKPHETVVAHIVKLQEILQQTKFNSITYCSSTRLYIHNSSTLENDFIKVDVDDPFELFNLTKLTAESLLKNTVENYKIVRLSNIFGDDFASDNFITSIVKNALFDGKIVLRTTPTSSKDYISIADTVDILIQIAGSKTSKGIYNIGYGNNVTNKQILNKISEVTGATIEYSANASEIIFPAISIDRIVKEFNFSPTGSVIDFLPGFIERFKANAQ